MEWSRIKTIILIILAVTNVSLLGFLVQRELQVQNARQEARQNSIQFLENNGVTVEDETVPEEMTLLPQTVEWDRGAGAGGRRGPPGRRGAGAGLER